MSILQKPLYSVTLFTLWCVSDGATLQILLLVTYCWLQTCIDILNLLFCQKCCFQFLFPISFLMMYWRLKATEFWRTSKTNSEMYRSKYHSHEWSGRPSWKSWWRRRRSDDDFSDDDFDECSFASKEADWFDEVASCGEQQTLWIHVCTRNLQSSRTTDSPLSDLSTSTLCIIIIKLPVYRPHPSGSQSDLPIRRQKPGLSPPDVTSHSMFPWRCRNTLEQNAASVSWTPSEA